MKIAVDAMGGDYAPAVVIDGSVQAAKEGVPVVLVGIKDEVEYHLAKFPTKGLPITIRHASEVVGMEESPVLAVRKKKDSSLRVCFDLVKNGEAGAVVSAGNSGAAMAAGMLVLKRLTGVERPAITVCWPTIKDGKVAILDVGGNVDCKPIHLAHFAIMGDVYAKYVLGRDNPRIALLSNGEEEGKGNELTRLTHELLKKSSLNYAGYIEGKDVFKGEIDVVVTDGFVGNVALKFGEGLVEAMVTMLKQNMQESLLAKIGYLLARGAFAKFKKKLDYAEYGGAPLLGIDGICIISHGSSSAKAIKNAIFRANEFIKCGVTAHMNEELAKNKDLAIVSERQTG